MLNYGKFPSWVFQACMRYRRHDGYRCREAFNIFCLLSCKRDTTTNLSHAISIDEICALTELKERTVYLGLNVLLKLRIIMVDSCKRGKFVFDLVCLRKDAAPSELDEIFGDDKHGEDQETIESFLRRPSTVRAGEIT